MVDIIDGSENVSVHGILNWILLLTICSIIVVVGNYILSKIFVFKKVD